MGIVSFSPLLGRFSGLSMLLAPVQAIAALFVPAQSASALTCPAPKSSVACRTSAVSYQALKPVATKPARQNIQHAPVQRLKVVRQFEPGASRSCAGRLVISGRMSDVCAELDRMAG